MTGWSVGLIKLLFFTTLTGSVFVLGWHVVRRILERLGFAETLYGLLRLTAVLFLLPVMFAAAYMLKWEVRAWGGVFFLYSSLILKVCRWIGAVWGLGAVGMTVFYFRCAWKQRQESHFMFECETEVRSLFRQICGEMNIDSRKVKLYQTYRGRVPYLQGCICPAVVLPAGCHYSQEQLRVIFVHELTHYRQGDHWTGLIMTLVLIVHFFNPLAWHLRTLEKRWSEYICDKKSYGMAGGVKIYFETVLAAAEQAGRNGALRYQVSGRKSDVYERVMYMKTYINQKRGSRRIVMLLCAIWLFGSGISAYALSVEAGAGYRDLYYDTVVDIEEVPGPQPVYTEYHDSGFGENIQAEEGATDAITRSMSTFNWSLAGNEAKYTAEVYAAEGESILVSVKFNPDNQNMRMGIMTSTGNRRYIVGSGYISYKFDIRESGYYRVFVENMNDVTVEVEGSFIV